MKWICKRIKKPIAVIIAVAVFAAGFGMGEKAEAAGTGYHTEYHSGGHNTYTVTGVVEGRSVTYWRYDCYYETYDYWTRYQWTDYVTYGEGVVWKMGTMVSAEAISYNDFVAKYNCGHTDCMGYDAPNTYTVAYAGNGHTGGATAASTHTYDKAKALTANGFTRTGYTFKGWNTRADGSGTSYADKASVKNLTAVNGGSVTLYAQWEKITFTLTLKGNGGSSPGPVTLCYGTSDYCNLSEVMANSGFGRAGYTFLGWYTSPTEGTQVYDAGGRCTNEGTYWKNDSYIYKGDCILYAHWAPNEAAVTYNANGGSWVSRETAVVRYGEQVDLNPTAGKEGYIFVGWNTVPDAKEGLASLIMEGTDITLYAIYSIPVSDVKELYIQSWVPGSPEDYRIYPLTGTGEKNMYYTYELPMTSIAADFGNVPVACSLFAWDNAGNYRVIKTWYPDAGTEEPETPEYFLQTVNHYQYDIVLKDWVLFETVSEEKMQGETYTPQYIAPPAGYRENHIDEPYVVEEDTVTGAYYSPMTYTLTFDPNGGRCDIAGKTVTYGDVYGEFPMAERSDHTFLGWFTEAEFGSQVTGSDRYEILGDSTLYAHWKMNEHTVYYDYRTNGGTNADKEYEVLHCGSAVDLTVAAEKNGWEHMGWNTDPDATAGMSSYILEDKDLTLYAIYKKEITITYIDCSGTYADGEPIPSTRQETGTIYNKSKKTAFIIPELNGLTGWQREGWSLSEEANGVIDEAAGTAYVTEEDVAFYGRYSKKVTVSYDTNGAAAEIPGETKVRQYNASGQSENPVFTLAEAPKLDNSSFVNWKDESGNYFDEGDRVIIKEDTVFTASWDKYPEIEAYDRYFSLEQAQKGKITPLVLLEKVKGRDKEDGELLNGTDVIVINYQRSDFTSFSANGSVSVTYQATDSFENRVTKTITVHIVDTSLEKDTTKQYVRFISKGFYMEGTDYISPELGGLEEQSVWKSNIRYKEALDFTLSNVKSNEKVIQVRLFGKDYKVTQPGSGSWNHSMETWNFTRNQIEEVKEYINTNGYGNYKSAEGLSEFRSTFFERSF